MEFKKLSKAEVEAIDKADIYVAEKATEGEVEGQGICRCSACGALLTVPGVPPLVTCSNCWNTFRVIWR